MAEKSTKNSVQVAVSALQQNPTLKQVLILPRSPRKDSEHLSDLSKHANTVLTQEVASSGFKDKIKIGSMDSIKTWKFPRPWKFPWVSTLGTAWNFPWPMEISMGVLITNSKTLEISMG